MLMTVKVPSAVIYDRPSPHCGNIIDGMITDEIFLGWNVEAYDDSNIGWVKIRTDYGYEGYMQKECLTVYKDSQLKKVVLKEKRFTDVTLTPDYRYAGFMTLIKGSVVDVICECGVDMDYYKIILPDGNEGCISKYGCSDYHEIKFKKGVLDKPKSSEQLRKKIIESAFMYLGSPYRWGGKSTNGIDCSGLCFMAYRDNDITIYRDADPFTEYTRKIELKNIKPADLLYFPGHVAMYIGNGRYIHATGASYSVRINSLRKDDKEFPFRSDLANSIKSVQTVFDE